MDGKMIEAGKMQVTIHLVALDHVEKIGILRTCVLKMENIFIKYL